MSETKRCENHEGSLFHAPGSFIGRSIGPNRLDRGGMIIAAAAQFSLLAPQLTPIGIPVGLGTLIALFLTHTYGLWPITGLYTQL
jgi:hypothetical protein